jgi:hypothetical protein
MRGEGTLNDLEVKNSFRFAVAVMVPAGIASAFCFGWQRRQNAAQHAAHRRLLYTAAGKSDVILNARTRADEVANVAIAPDLAVPGYGLVRDHSNSGNWLLSYPATS